MPELVDGSTGRDEYIARFAGAWRHLDADEFAFVHEIVEESPATTTPSSSAPGWTSSSTASGSRPSPLRELGQSADGRGDAFLTRSRATWRAQSVTILRSVGGLIRRRR